MNFTKTTLISCMALITGNLALAEPSNLSSYLGINNGTGYVPEARYTDQSIAATKDLGLGLVRMGMDGVWGNTVGAAFDWEARDMVVNKYKQAGLKIHAVISARGHVHRDADFKVWQANWSHFVRNVMERYKDSIDYYIIDNEPDLDYGNGKMNANECLTMTRIAYTIAKEINPNIKIESPPVASPESDLLAEMLDAGIAQFSDYIGIHAYGGQIRDDRFARPWQLLEERGLRKPIAVSESGSITDWCEGTQEERELCRGQWFVEFAQQLKRYGYDHALLFDLEGHDSWAIAPDFQPTHTYQQIKNLKLDSGLTSEGFEEAVSAWDLWQPTSANQFGSTDGIRIVNQSHEAKSGDRHLRFETGITGSNSELKVRRIVGQLQPGAVRIQAWVYVGGSGQARLKALGFDQLDGDKELTTQSLGHNTWELLELQVPISRDSFVLELEANGTDDKLSFVRWDDIELQTPSK